MVASPEIEAMPQPVMVVLASAHRHRASYDAFADSLVAAMEANDEGRQASTHGNSAVAGGELSLPGDDPGCDEGSQRFAPVLKDRQLGQPALAPTERQLLPVDLLLLGELSIGHGGECALVQRQGKGLMSGYRTLNAGCHAVNLLRPTKPGLG